MTKEEFERLYTEYSGKVMLYVGARVKNRADAEDLCAEVFEKALRASDSYDSSKAAPGTWLYAIARNAVIDYFRGSRPSEELPEDLADDSAPDEGLLRSELLEELAGALEKLSPELTEIIVLRYNDCLPLTEIALRVGLSYGAVKLRHQKALAALRSAMKSCCFGAF
ncbi:MAG: sigma-70 family RNA polymerase sigma factor [Oscillospiraceae bacterium]|nr:sigma-70 family RNA polymerase sigma factor [Oscillospiraceae bacterium]